ncbi:DUF739 family protein [Shuttleworthella satelles]|uniref:Toxin-antitoxin system, antitoxin component, Xre family n=1 Tax=Shuttleworthella satelles DSM 14600 TaxID=626523 RepID=C4GAU8_9FIRM|nr:toxin-antitoxin system, antitoxin component, Xre family [Shuttleworthia satelles DSM 14600]
MGFSYNKLRGRIIEKFGTQEKFAKELGISNTTLSRKMTGEVQFTQKDIIAWCELLDVNLSDAAPYFFT